VPSVSNAALSGIQPDKAAATASNWSGRRVGEDNMAKYSNCPIATQEQVTVKAVDGRVRGTCSGCNFNKSLANKLRRQLYPTVFEKNCPRVLQQRSHFRKRHRGNSQELVFKTAKFMKTRGVFPFIKPHGLLLAQSLKESARVG
jgi:hypothetical protein